MHLLQPVLLAAFLCVATTTTAYGQPTIYFNPGSDKQMRVHIEGSTLYYWTWDLGEAFDSLGAIQDIALIPQGNEGLCVFTETPLELSGFNITGKVTIGSARQIRLMDDVRVGGPTSGPPEYRVDTMNVNCVGITCEGDIKIANTPRNGRENCNGPGPDNQPSQFFKDIVLTAAIVALGSFEFEQQNHPDSGYVGPTPDLRGTIWLYGSLTQGEVGNLWTPYNGGTGYGLELRFDQRFLDQQPPCLSPSQNQETTDTLFFGDVPVGTTVWDTAHVYTLANSYLGAVIASYPFDAERIEPFSGGHFVIPVSFTPSQTGPYTGMLNVSTSYHYYQIVLRGTGIPGGAPPVTEPSIYPNPFNNSTAISFTIETAGRVALELYDILGRRALTAFDGDVQAGTQSLRIDAQTLSSGIYFAHLRTPSQQKTMKLLLVR